MINYIDNYEYSETNDDSTVSTHHRCTAQCTNTSSHANDSQSSITENVLCLNSMLRTPWFQCSDVRRLSAAAFQFASCLSNAMVTRLGDEVKEATPLQSATRKRIRKVNNNRDDIYGAVIMAKPLREFTRFIWWMQTQRRGGRQPSDQANW